MLLPLPDQQITRIVVGTTVRKNLEILKPYLDSLDRQELPPRTSLIPAFVPDFTPEQADAQAYLFQWVNERGGTLIHGAPANSRDFSDAPGLPTHEWQPSAMARVGHNKNRIIQFAVEQKADYLWLADSDLILDRTSLASLLSCERHIVTGVYWTQWSAAKTETGRNDAGPQVWLQHPYQLEGRGMDAAEFRTKLLSRELVRVWGFGANTLIDRKALEAGVSFEFLPDVPMTGLMAGEDRHFSIRCERMHIDAWADCWPDIFHIYHAATDVPKIPAMVERLSQDHPKQPRYGDLVSVRLRALEPIPIGPNRVQQQMPQHVRGRLGQIAVLPEIETAIAGMTRGQTRTVSVHFPIHHPVPFLRGKTRLIEVWLIDTKPFQGPPVVDEELFISPVGAVMDSASYSAEQVAFSEELAQEHTREVANG